MSSVVPEGWITSRIQEVVLKVIDNRGKTPPLSDSGYNLIEVACVRDDKQFLDYEKITKCVSEDTYQTWFRNGHPKVGDTIVPTVGSIGEFAFVRENRGCIAQNLVALRPSAVIEPLFLYFQCYSEVVQNNISRILMGAVQPSLRVPHFLETSLLLPPLPEQKKIASILTSVDEVIENTQKQIDKLQDLKKATMNELLTKGIGHTEFKDSELGRIPKSWEVRTVGELGSLKNGLNKPKESFGYGTKFVNISDAYPVQLNCDSLGRLDASTKEIKDYSLEGGDLVFVRSSVKLGGVAIPTEFCYCGEPVVFCGFMIRFRPHLKGLESSFLRQYLLNDATRVRIERLATGGANININQEALSQFKVLLPTTEEQKYFSSVNVGFEDSLQKYQEKLSQTQSLKKSLMQDLLTGKVRVTVN
ncbi:restriction endonuclease subunit S [Candidatus Njordibacter sp. Uisw_058]|uniref:restriction endonuclease subunit S n=1 Tax=Candidatus Njordibacter sp. Uisw_058 TaxID=3230974 RepID=UPI003D3D99A9